MRIFVNNNSGGETMYHAMKLKGLQEDEMDYIGAKRNHSVKGWAEDRGFIYLSANDITQFDEIYKEFVNGDYDKPIIFEVFSNKMENMKHWNDMFASKRKVLEEENNRNRVSKIEKGKKYIIYGTGSGALKVKKEIEDNGGIIIGFCDSNREKWGTEFMDMKVISPVEIVSKEFEDVNIAIGSVYYGEIRKILLAIGVYEQHIVSPLL